jgi:hypothetical protein
VSNYSLTQDEHCNDDKEHRQYSSHRPSHGLPQAIFKQFSEEDSFIASLILNIFSYSIEDNNGIVNAVSHIGQQCNDKY